MQRRDINAPDAPAPVSAYTQAVEVTGATRILYISGQVGIGPDGNVPDNIEAQSRLVWGKETGSGNETESGFISTKGRAPAPPTVLASRGSMR